MVVFRIITDEQINVIKKTAYKILARTGCIIKHTKALDLLAEAGAEIKGDRVCFPAEVVDLCIESAPKGFIMYDRNGKVAMDVSRRKSYYGTSTASPNTRDISTGEIRETTVADIAVNAKIADALQNIDFVMPMGSAQDVPAEASELHEFYAVVTNTIKPIVFNSFSVKGMELIFNMAAKVVGGLENLQEKPFVMSYPEPVSPLIVPKDVIEKMFLAADLSLPQVPAPTVQPGATGPVTIAGAVAQLVAEGLMSLILIQLRNPGAPCVLGGNLNIFDMKTTLMSVAAPEMSLGIAAQAEVAQSLGLPSWGMAGTTDSKLLDA